MNKVYITGSGLWVPPNLITNAELVASYNEYVRRTNERNAAAIASGEVAALPESSSEFIEKASGIKQRYVVEKTGVLDPGPHVSRDSAAPERTDLVDGGDGRRRRARGAGQCRDARRKRSTWSSSPAPICSGPIRPSPSRCRVALGCGGYGYDMNVACSSATFGIEQAANAVRSGSARCALVISPELPSGHLEWRDRDCHFIFGDIATAVVVEAAPSGQQKSAWEILGSKAATVFSNNIRNNSGFLDRCDPADRATTATSSSCRKAARCSRKSARWPPTTSPATSPPTVLRASDVKRFWLHQANLTMNQLDREAHPRARRHTGRSARHPRQVRQHGLGRFHHRVPSAQRRSCGRERRRHLLVRGGVFDRQPHPQAGLTVSMANIPDLSCKK